MQNPGKTSHMALYGGVQIRRDWCSYCQQMAFVIDNEMACCGQDADVVVDGLKPKRESGGYSRNRPTKDKQIEILHKQENKCFYCDREFGSIVYRNEHPVLLKTHWDHLVPHAYSGSSLDKEFVAACHVCNNYKNKLLFESIESAQIFLKRKWDKGGYSDATSSI